LKTLAQAFRSLLLNDGWYVLHIQKQLNQPCTVCSTLEPNSHCKTCLGSGFRVQLSPILTRSSSATRPDYTEQDETPVGIIGSQSMLYYTLPENSVNEGDMILSVSWSVPTDQVPRQGQVVAVHKVFEANRVDAKLGERGELAYYRVSTHDMDVDLKWMARCLVQSRPI